MDVSMYIGGLGRLLQFQSRMGEPGPRLPIGARSRWLQCRPFTGGDQGCTLGSPDAHGVELAANRIRSLEKRAPDVETDGPFTVDDAEAKLFELQARILGRRGI